MGDSQFVKKIKMACNSLGIESNVWFHFKRKTAPAILNLVKVNELDKRALGN